MESILKFIKNNEESFSFVLILAILVLLVIIYYRFYKRKQDGFVKYIRHFLLPVTFITGFVIYFIGYQYGNEAHCSWWGVIPNFFESIFSTTRLFILGNDLVEIKEGIKENAFFHAMFSLTAALAAFIFISFVAQVFFKNWLVKGRIKRNKGSENHFFFGINQSSLSLSTDLLKKDNRLVVFVNDFDENEDQHLYSELSDGAYVIKRKSFFESISLEKEEGLFQFFKNKKNNVRYVEHNDDIFYKLKVLKDKIGIVETHLYLLTDDDDWNIKHARLIINELDEFLKPQLYGTKLVRKNIDIQPVRIHVVTYNEMSEKHFTKSLENKLPDYLSVVVHNYATVVSGQLIDKYHPVKFVEVEKEKALATTDFNALIVGFGQIGTHVLRKLIEQGQFVGSTFHATVIDESVHSHEGRFEHLYPEVKTNYDVQFVDAEVGHHSFYKTVKKLIAKTNYIVIALGNDDLNIQTALEILEIESVKDQKLLKTFVHLEDESHWQETLSKYKDRIYIFGKSDDVFTESNILQREVLKRARLVHQVYNILNNTNASFDKIPRHDQLSNISVAEHLYAKVRLLGYEGLDEFSRKFANNDEYVNSLTKVQELNLSILEHLRWNAFHFIHGWTSLPLDEIKGDTEKERDINRRKDDLRMHACLTSWKKLEQLGKLIGKDMQAYDTMSIKHLYDFINYRSNEND